jgi:type IV secretory pathway TrbL component
MLHGKEAREEIEARQNNIENERMRLAEGVGGLTREDVQRLKEQRRAHERQRRDLEQNIDRQLEALEQGPGGPETSARASRKTKSSDHMERFSRAAAPEQDNSKGREAAANARRREEEQDFGISRDHG